METNKTMSIRPSTDLFESFVQWSVYRKQSTVLNNQYHAMKNMVQSSVRDEHISLLECAILVS